MTPLYSKRETSFGAQEHCLVFPRITQEKFQGTNHLDIFLVLAWHFEKFKANFQSK